MRADIASNTALRAFLRGLAVLNLLSHAVNQDLCKDQRVVSVCLRELHKHAAKPDSQTERRIIRSSC